MLKTQFDLAENEAFFDFFLTLDKFERTVENPNLIGSIMSSSDSPDSELLQRIKTLEADNLLFRRRCEDLSSQMVKI